MDLIDKDMTLGIRLGGAQDGAPNFSGSVIVITCPSEDYSYDNQGQTVDTAGRCDDDQKIRVTRSQARITLRLKVPATGKIIPTDSMGVYIELTVLDGPGLVAETFIGVITGIGHSSPPNAPQVQNITIAVGAA